MLEKNKVPPRKGPVGDVALHGVPGEGSAHVRSLRPGAAGRGEGGQLQSSALVAGVAPPPPPAHFLQCRWSDWRGTPPHTPWATVTLRAGRGSGGPGSQPEPLGSCGRRGEPAGGRACRSAARALIAGGRGRGGRDPGARGGGSPGRPGAFPGGSSRESRQPPRGTQAKAPRQKTRR